MSDFVRFFKPVAIIIFFVIIYFFSDGIAKTVALIGGIFELLTRGVTISRGFKDIYRAVVGPRPPKPPNT